MGNFNSVHLKKKKKGFGKVFKDITATVPYVLCYILNSKDQK